MMIYSAYFSRLAALILMLLGFAYAPLAAANCSPTPSLTVENYPGARAIPHGNHLLLPAGKSVASGGQRLIVMGRLLDKRCLPVPEAVIEMWQADPYGHWILAGSDDLVTPNPTFAGAGRAVTDKDGRFVFTTAFPAAMDKRAPNLNIKVKPLDMAGLSTMLFFANDLHNLNDPVYKRLNASSRDAVTLRMGQTPTGDLTAAIDLVLAASVPYRTY